MIHIFHQLPSRHKRLIIILSIVVVILSLLPSEDAKASRSSDDSPTLEVAQRYHAPLGNTLPTLVENTHSKVKKESTSLIWQTVTVKAGDNLALIFDRAGFSARTEPNVIMNLANIFGWDIDFGLGIRQGDYFNIIYEKKFLDGVEVKMGNIIAAEFVNRGKSYRAIRHNDGEYYSPEGRNMRKAFLRAPVNFKYISSSFNPRRLHPVTGRVTAHNGIDYAAKRGTPVQASGSGTVIASSYNRYNGNYVFIKHGEKYVTKYLHLTKKYVRKGARVKQGQKIGTVGSTGRVTGAHLHYEFLVNGVHHNPRTIKLPKAQSIARKEKRKFLSIAKARIEQLDTNKRIMLAANQE